MTWVNDLHDEICRERKFASSRRRRTRCFIKNLRKWKSTSSTGRRRDEAGMKVARTNRAYPVGWILYLGAATAPDAPCSPNTIRKDVPWIHLSLTPPGGAGRKYKATNSAARQCSWSLDPDDLITIRIS